MQIEDDRTVEPGTPWVSGDPEIREGRTYILDLHDNETGVIRWEVNWGDGSATEIFEGDVTQVTHFYADGDENFTINITAVKEEIVEGGEPVGGWQGLSHGYWKNHPQDWVFFETTDNYEAVFGVGNSQKPGTLMQAVKTGGGGIKALWRESVAALLNATHPNIAYKFSVDEIISMVRAAYASGEYNHYKDILETENTRHNVDINNPGSGGSTGTTTREVRVELEKELFVGNVAPDLTITGESKTLPDTAYVLHLSEYDPGDDTITHWTINWGDGTETVVQGNPSEVTHIYTTVGDYTITATATDEDGVWNANTVDVRVYEPQTGLVKGTPWLSGDPEILEGRTYTLDLHANEADILRWEINWGDGSVTQVVEGALDKATHFYADGDENFTISVVAVKRTDSGTENVSLRQALLVLNVAPVLVISGSSKSEKDKEYLLNLSEYDPGDDTITHWTINWGDGTVETIQGNPSGATHVYSEAGQYFVTATATDEDGTWNSNSIDVLVYVDETGRNTGIPYITGDPEILEGRTYTLDLHANEADILRWEIHWGDGSGPRIVEGNARYATHFYADGDEYFTISVVAVKQTDSGSENVELTKDLFVKNVAPTLTISGPAASQPNAVYQLGLSSYDPGDYAVTIHLVDEDGIPIETPDDDVLRWKDGVLQWKPEDTTPKKFIIRAENEHGAWSQQSFTIHPMARPVVNNVPVITSLPLGPTMVGDNYTYQVEAYDPDGDTLTYAVDEASQLAGITIDENSGLLHWSPTEAGVQEITVIVTDSHDNVRTQTFKLGVNPQPKVSQPPVITSKPTGPAYVSEQWSYTISAYDPDQDAITLLYWDDDIQDWAPIDPVKRIITWTPDTEGEMTFIIRAEDVHGFWTEQSFVIKAVEVPSDVEAPRITSVPTGPAFVDERYEYQVTAQVFDGSQPTFTVDQASAECGITINAQGKLSWIPGTEGTFTVIVTVTDGSNKFASQIFELETVQRQIVTVPPTITSKPTGPAYVNDPWTYQLTGVATDGSAVDFYLVDENGDVIRKIDNGLLTETWSAEGTQNLIVRAVDSRGASIEQHITIQVVQHVVETNSPPVVYSIPIEQIRLGNLYQYMVKAYDPDGDTIAFKIGKGPDGASISADGVLSWNPSVVGNYEFIILVWDVNKKDGSENHSPVEHRFTLSVLPPVTINRPPQITSVPLTSTMKDREYQYQATATDLDGDTITWHLHDIDIPAEARGNIRMDMNTGLLTWTPGVAGTFTFTVAAFDGNEYAEQIITLYVADNAPPVITGLPEPNVEFGEEYTSQVIAHDPNGDEITYRLENAPGGLTIGADGTLAWETPILGRHNITVIVTDSHGATARRQFQLNVVDSSVPNEAPTLIGSMPGAVPVNVPFTCQLIATDQENDPVTFKLLEGPEGMTISSGGRIEWTPGEVGDATFKVSISDGINPPVEYICTMTVVAQRENNKPVFTSESTTGVTVNKQYVYQPTAMDPDGDSVVISLVGGPTGLKMNAQGEIVWTPSSAWAGQTVSFTLRAMDAYGAFEDQVVNLSVRSVILAPTLVMEPLPVGKVGQEWTYQVKATDPQGEKVTFELVEGEYPDGMTIDAQTGVVRYTPTELPAAPYYVIWFKVRAVNESGVASNNGVFPLQVDPNSVGTPGEPGGPGGPGGYNNPPQLTLPNSHFIEAGKPWSHQVIATDLDGDTLEYTLNNPPAGMTIDSATGVISWLPGTNIIGNQYEISITVSDGQASAYGSFWIGIQEPNALPVIKAIPAQKVTTGTTFSYYASATDTNRTDTLTYSLDAASLALGMTINSQTGQISWKPGTERADSAYNVTVFVTDGRDEPVSTTFNLQVVEDKIAPTVNIVATPSKTAAGDQVTIYVSATDNVGVKTITLQLKSIKDAVT